MGERMQQEKRAVSFFHPLLCKFQFKGGCRDKKCTKIHIEMQKTETKHKKEKKQNKEAEHFLELKKALKTVLEEARSIQNQPNCQQNWRPNWTSQYTEPNPYYPVPQMGFKV